MPPPQRSHRSFSRRVETIARSETVLAVAEPAGKMNERLDQFRSQDRGDASIDDIDDGTMTTAIAITTSTMAELETELSSSYS